MRGRRRLAGVARPLLRRRCGPVAAGALFKVPQLDRRDRPRRRRLGRRARSWRGESSGTRRRSRTRAWARACSSWARAAACRRSRRRTAAPTSSRRTPLVGRRHRRARGDGAQDGADLRRAAPRPAARTGATPPEGPFDVVLMADIIYAPTAHEKYWARCGRLRGQPQGRPPSSRSVCTATRRTTRSWRSSTARERGLVATEVDVVQRGASKSMRVIMATDPEARACRYLGVEGVHRYTSSYPAPRTRRRRFERTHFACILVGDLRDLNVKPKLTQGQLHPRTRLSGSHLQLSSKSALMVVKALQFTDHGQSQGKHRASRPAHPRQELSSSSTTMILCPVLGQGVLKTTLLLFYADVFHGGAW